MGTFQKFNVSRETFVGFISTNKFFAIVHLLDKSL